MSEQPADTWRDRVVQQRGILVPVFIVTAVLVLFVPLPPLAMDFLLACNVTLSVVILLTTIYVARPLDFNVFPTILLGTTLARLVLNVASTRLILTGAGERGTGAAGGVIEAFGLFVSGDNVAVGVIVFAIIVVIQFVVITKGATRISEVSARFALDGMPGKQMSIDADLSAGLIDAAEAKRRRQEVSEQADFYGSMDGASKFVRGDAVAGIIITLINIAGGLYVGMIQQDMKFEQAVTVFTTLTIGDGLVSQVPAFLVSLAAGLIVTRSSSKSDLPQQVISQMLAHPAAMVLSGIFLAFLAVTGLPMLPLTCLSLLCFFLARQINTKKKVAEATEERQQAEQATQETEHAPEDDLIVDILEISLGANLLKLTDPNSGGTLSERIVRMRNVLATELGFIVPKIRLRDDTTLGINEYRILLRDNPVAKGELHVDGLLAVDTGNVSKPVPGLETIEPSGGQPARWIEPGLSERAKTFGYYIIEPVGALVMHLIEVIRMHADEILTREHTYELIENLKRVAPKFVEELIPEPLSTGLLHNVLRRLLKEGVPIRDLESILTALGDSLATSKEPAFLTENVRVALARTISEACSDHDGRLHVITIDPHLQAELMKSVRATEAGFTLDIPPQIGDRLIQEIAKHMKTMQAAALPQVLLCRQVLRLAIRRLTLHDLPQLHVISEDEVAAGTSIEVHGQVSFQFATAATPE